MGDPYSRLCSPSYRERLDRVLEILPGSPGASPPEKGLR